jgi:hypothetical protein
MEQPEGFTQGDEHNFKSHCTTWNNIQGLETKS